MDQMLALFFSGMLKQDEFFVVARRHVFMG